MNGENKDDLSLINPPQSIIVPGLLADEKMCPPLYSSTLKSGFFIHSVELGVVRAGLQTVL